MAKYKGVKILEVLEGADRYNRWIAERISPYIESPALEIGAGTGNISSFFSHLKSLTLTDNDESLISVLQKKFNTKNIHAEVFDIQKDFYKINNSFKTIFSVNVLEHIKDDSKALSNMYRLLKRNGKVVILVPAKKFAYTNLDKDLGHFRRYEKEELREKLEKAGFKIESITYFNIVGLLSWILRDKFSRNNKTLAPSHVKLFDLSVPILKRIEPKTLLPQGISLIAIATKI